MSALSICRQRRPGAGEPIRVDHDVFVNSIVSVALSRVYVRYRTFLLSIKLNIGTDDEPESFVEDLRT
jgi:hypothetical protein